MLCIIQWSPSLLQCWGISEIIAMHVSWPGLVMCCTVFWSLVTCTALLSRMPGWPDVASCCVSIVCSLTFVKNILSQLIIAIIYHMPISGEFAIFLINMRPYYILYGNFEPIFLSFGFSLSICSGFWHEIKELTFGRSWTGTHIQNGSYSEDALANKMLYSTLF